MKDFPSPSFLLVVKAGHAGALALARIMRSWLETRRASATILAADAPAETLRAAAAGRSAVGWAKPSLLTFHPCMCRKRYIVRH